MTRMTGMCSLFASLRTSSIFPNANVDIDTDALSLCNDNGLSKWLDCHSKLLFYVGRILCAMRFTKCQHFIPFSAIITWCSIPSSSPHISSISLFLWVGGCVCVWCACLRFAPTKFDREIWFIIARNTLIHTTNVNHRTQSLGVVSLRAWINRLSRANEE